MNMSRPPSLFACLRRERTIELPCRWERAGLRWRTFAADILELKPCRNKKTRLTHGSIAAKAISYIPVRARSLGILVFFADPGWNCLPEFPSAGKPVEFPEKTKKRASYLIS